MRNSVVVPAPRSIVVAQLAFIGDMVFTAPLLDELAERWPAADLVVVGRPRALDVLEDHPGVAARIPYDKEGRDRGIAGAFRVARAVRSCEPELFFGVTRSGRTAWLSVASGARARVGFAGRFRRGAYNVLVNREDVRRPLPLRPLALLEGLGLHPGPRPLRLTVGERRRDAARGELLGAGWRGEPLLAVAPGAHYATKRWPERHVARFLDLVLADETFRPALYGGPEEDGIIGRLLSGRPLVLDRRGIGVRGVMADLSLATAFVGGDSGPAHIARAMGVRVVVLYGPTDPDLLADGRPYAALSRGLPCQPCSVRGDAVCPLGHHACLEEMAPGAVYAAVLETAAPGPA